MNALKNFTDMGGSVTRQVGNYIFGLDNSNLMSDTAEVLAFSANDGSLIKSKMITPKQQAKIKTVDDIHDYIFGKPSKPDFTKVLV